jgi:hypothetical protein
MRLSKAMMLGSVLALATACGGDDVNDTEYVESMPDLAGLSMEINEGADEGARLVAEGFGEYEAALQAQATAPEYLEGARMSIRALNAVLKEQITRLVELTNGDLKESKPGDVLVYGPRDGANANWRLQVKKLGERRFGWKLEARPLGSTDDTAFKVVSAGRMARGEVANRGRGTLGVNLDVLKQVAPNTPGQGKLLASFAHPPAGGKVLSYRLVGFTPNATNHEPVSGAFVGHKLAGGLTRIRVVAQKDFTSLPNNTSAKETFVNRVRFKPGVGGRADIVVFGGDVPVNQIYLGAACWDPQEQEKFKVLRVCTKQEGAPPQCEIIASTGSRAACPADNFLNDMEPPQQNPDPGDTAPEPDAPEAPEAPPADVVADF